MESILNKGEYVSPEVNVIEIHGLGIICQSGEAPDMQEGWSLKY